MHWLTLFTGLLLPWLGGVFWLVFIESRFSGSARPNRLRQAGYGFFLGYAVLCLAVLAWDAWTGHVSWPGLMAFLVLFAAGGGLAASRGAKSPPPTNAAERRPATTSSKILLAILAAWMALHLLFIAVEVLYQPLYPWDAWLVWVYRAKAWFFSGGLAEMVGAGEWAAAQSPDVFTASGADYPPLPSVVPYWAALSLGHWSESLVNAPVLLLAVAIGLALYGQCREAGMSALLSLAACYLMFSVPLFGTHLALAGYADIWVAGFTGLAFIALLRGAADGDRFQTGLGLCMAILALSVKNEAVVWLLAALLLQALISFRYRTLLLAGVAIAALGLIAGLLGVTHIEIPLLGTLGVVDNRLVIPFVGNFALQMHDFWLPYRDNFFMMGSWNLLWLLVAAGLLAAAIHGRRGARPAVRAGATFILVFAATQVFIFGFTDQGVWADTYTAINRLPIHFTPALLFASALIFHQRLVQAMETPTSGEPSRA